MGFRYAEIKRTSFLRGCRVFGFVTKWFAIGVVLRPRRKKPNEN